MMYYANKYSFYFFPLIFVFYFSCFIAQAITAISVLNNSDASGHPWPIPDLRKKALSIS